MSASLSLTQTQLFTALGAVLGTFPLVSSTSSAPIIQRGQINRVAEPAVPDFILLWPLMRMRLATNIDSTADVTITGSITSNVLTLATISNGMIIQGIPLYGAGVATGCTIGAQLSGTPGGIGTYAVSTTPNIASSTLYAGCSEAYQETEITVQCDVHGPLSADNAQVITTLFRDQFAVSAFASANAAVAPLYSSEPRQIPFLNGEQQIEERWSIDLVMQANITVSITQQFADVLTVTPESVDVFYPAA